MSLLGFFLTICAALLTETKSCNIPLTSLSASSSLNSTEYSPAKAAGTSRKTKGIWCMGSRQDDPNPWIQVNLYSQRNIIGVKLTGGGQDFASNELKAFKVSYSENSQIWALLRENHDSQTDKVFDGISSEEINTNVIKVYTFPYQIRANYLRLNLLLEAEKNGTCLRFDLLQQDEFCNNITPTDLLFSMEMPNTWDEEDFNKAKYFVSDLLTGILSDSDSVKVGLMTYNWTPHYNFHLNNNLDFNETIAAVQGLSFSGQTARIHEALSKVASVMLDESKGNRAGIADTLIVITDGHYDHSKIAEKVSTLEAEGTTRYVVCIGKEPDLSVLTKIASSPDSQYVMCDATVSLPGYLQILTRTFMEDPSVVTADLGNTQFMFSAQKATYKSAEKHCRQFGGSLASINSSTESDLVQGQVEALLNSTGCQQWWIGHHASSQDGLKYWTDGSVMSFKNFVVSPDGGDTPETDAFYLDYSQGWKWNNTALQTKLCYICKDVTGGSDADILFLADTYVISVMDCVTFAVLVNTTSPFVTVNIEGHTLLTLYNYVNFYMRSYQLSKFELKDKYNGWHFGLYNFCPSATGQVTFKPSVPPNIYGLGHVITVRIANEAELCLEELLINQTGNNLQLPEMHLINYDLNFSLVLDSICEGLVVQVISLSLEKKVNSGVGCLEDDFFELVDISNMFQFNKTDSGLWTAPEALSYGCYMICFDVLIQYTEIDYSKNLCGFLEVTGFPLVLVLSPNATQLIHYNNMSLVFNASASYDPNTDTGPNLSFIWTCMQSGIKCDFVASMWPGENYTSNQLQLPTTNGVLEIPGEDLTAGDFYTFAVSVVSPYIAGDNHTYIVIIKQSAEVESHSTGRHLLQNLSLVLTKICSNECLAQAEDLTLTVNCTDCYANETVVYTWNMYIEGGAEIPLNGPHPEVVFINDTTLTIPEHLFNPFQNYSISARGATNYTAGITYYIISPQDEIMHLTRRMKTTPAVEDSVTMITYLVLLNDSSSWLSVTVDEYYSCTLEVSTLTTADRTTPPLSSFDLTAAVNGVKFAVFDTLFWSAGSFTVNVTSSEHSRQLLNVVDTLQTTCIDAKLNGTSISLHNAQEHVITDEINFVPEFSGVCVNVEVQHYYWFVRVYQEENITRCPVEEDFQLVATPGSSVAGTLHLGPLDLEEGYYRICVTSDMGTVGSYHVGNVTICGYIHIIPSPLTILVSPNVTEFTHDRNLPLILNASASYNPNTEEHTIISFTWTCVTNSEQCDFVQQVWTGVGDDTHQLPVTDNVLEIQGHYLTSGESYIFTVTIEAENVTGNNHSVTVTANGTIPLHLNATCLTGCDSITDPTVWVQVNCSNCEGNTTYTWTIEEDGSTLSDSIWMLFAIVDDASLVLPTSIFNPLKTYSISVFGSEDNGATACTGTTSVSIPTREFSLLLLPLSYIVYTDTYDMFLILISGPTPSDLQVTYDDTCIPSTPVVTPAARDTYPLSAFSLPSSADSMRYSVISHQYMVPGMSNVSASMTIGAETITSIVSISVQNKDEHHCLTFLEIVGTGRTLATAKVHTLGHHIHFTPIYTGSCDDMVIVSYNWTLFQDSSDDPLRCIFEGDFVVVSLPHSDDTDHDESFHVPSKTLPLGYNRLCLEIVYISSSGGQHKNRGCGFIKVNNEPLVASLSPSVSFLTLPRSRTLVLNASTSYNPNSDDQINFQFTWSCIQNGGICDIFESVWPGQTTQTIVPVTDPVLTIPAGSLTVGQNYDFSVSVSKTGLEGANTSISVRGTNPTTPSLLVRCRLGCDMKLNPSERLALVAECSNCVETGLSVTSYTWSVTSMERDETISSQDLIPRTTTGIHQTAFVLSAYFLNSSDVYAITVTGINSHQESGSAVYRVYINSPPVPGTCSISPQTGQALGTHFTITCSNFEDPDPPLLYKVYRERENGETSQLLFYGFESTISHLTFPTGAASNNYTHTITVSVFDFYNTSTSVHLLVQVLQVASPQASNESVSDLVYNLLQNFTVESVHEGESPGVLSFVGNVASILNDEVTDQQNDSVVKRAEVRETILTTLAVVKVDSQDTLQQMTDIVGDLTAKSDEVTENMQDLAVNVSRQLTESLGSVAQTAPTVAKDIAVKQLSTLENLIELTLAREVETVLVQPGDTNNLTTPSPPRSVEDKAKPILDLYEKIGDAMLKGMQFASEEPLVIESKKTSLALSWRPVDTEEDVEVSTKLKDGTVEGKFQIPLKTSMQSNSASNQGVQAVNFQVQVMANNPYVWDETAADVNMPVLNVVMKSRDDSGTKIQLSDLPEPAGILITANLSSLSGSASDMNYTTEHEVNVTVENNIITSSNSKLVKIYNNVTTIVRIKSLTDNITLTTHAVANDNITVAELKEHGKDVPIPSGSLQTSGQLTQDPNLMILKETADPNSYYTLGFTVKPGQVLDSVGENVSTVGVLVETFSVSCSFWDDVTDKWGTSGCQVSKFTSLERLHCLCDHLTAFSGGIFVAPNTVDPIADIALFLQFFDNPVVVTACIAVWGVYLLLLYWARQKDKEDAKKVGMTVLRDNDPRDKYVYLICVVTSWWPQAGTTANVFLYLRSKYKQSARHMLADPQRKLFTPGAENWFVLTTPQRLGKIKSVIVWHDNKGKSPSWYLKEVVVHDIQTKDEWHCLYDDWLAVDRGSGFIQVEVPSLQKSDMIQRRMYQLSLKSSQDFRNGHLWISIFSKPAYNHFTRAQRLTCGLSLLITTMLANIMFFGVPTDDAEDQLQHGGLVISLSGIVIGIESGLMMFPVNTLIIQFFMKSAPKESPAESDLLFKESSKSLRRSKTDVEAGRKSKDDVSASKGAAKSEVDAEQKRKRCKGLLCCASKETSDTGDGSAKGDEVDIGMSRAEVHTSTDNMVGENGDKSKTKKAKKPFSFPWWFIYIAWTISLSTCIICTYFIMLYGLKYGYQKSVNWLVSFFTAFTQSALVTQPIKVIVLAVLLTQILRRPVEYESWGVNQDIEEENIEQLTDRRKTSSEKDDLHRYYVPPLTVSMLQQIRRRIQLDNRARMILYEIGLYFTFVAVVLLMIYGHRNIDTTFMVTRTTENMFTQDTGFSEVSDVDSMWEYLKDHFVDHLVTDDEGVGLTSCQASYLLGKARLRQLRVKPGQCNYPGIMKMYAPISCTGSYWITEEDTGTYNNSWSQPLDSQPNGSLTAYTHQSAFQLVTLPFVAKLATYSGGGFVQELPKMPNDSRTVMDGLMNSDWIDQHTRAVFVEFTLYNPNVNLFSVVILLFEFSNYGGVFPYYQIFTSNLYHYTGGLQIFVAVCEVMFLIYLLVFTVLEIKKFRRMTCKEYFEDVWSYIEVTIIVLSYTVFGVFIQRILTVEYSLRLYKESKGQSYVSFYPAASSDIILQYLMASLSMFIIIKFFKLLRFNVRMSLLAGTIKRCKGLLIQYFIQILIFTMGFATFGVLVFATALQEYSNFGESLITLFNFALGASDYFGLEGASSTFGPVFFFAFLCLYQFLLIMVFCTILIEGYASMIIHIMSVKTEVHMVEFISKRIQLMTMTDKKKKNIFRKHLYEVETDR